MILINTGAPPKGPPQDFTGALPLIPKQNFSFRGQKKFIMRTVHLWKTWKILPPCSPLDIEQKSVNIEEYHKDCSISRYEHFGNQSCIQYQNIKFL